MATNEADVSFTGGASSAPWRDVRDRGAARLGTPPFRADHVGRLLQPPKLVTARNLYERRVITAEALQEFEDAAIQHAVRYQESLGLRSVTDGGYRQRSVHVDLATSLGRIEVQGGVTRSSTARSHLVTRRDFLFLKTVVGTVSKSLVPKMIVPAPTMVHLEASSAIAGELPDPEQLDEELAAAYARELALLSQAGCTYVQFDDGTLADLCDEYGRELARRRGQDPDRQLERAVRLINSTVAARPAGMSVCLYLWRGNFRESWLGERVHQPALESLFNELQVDGFFLGYREARQRDFVLLRHVPRDKKAVLGLVGSCAGQPQSKSDLKRSIDMAAKYLPLEQLCLAPQCGFSTMDYGQHIDVDVQTAKLRLVVETANEVWGDA